MALAFSLCKRSVFKRKGSYWWGWKVFFKSLEMCYLKQTIQHVVIRWERFAGTRRMKQEREKSTRDREKGARCLWGAATQVVNPYGMEGEDFWFLRIDVQASEMILLQGTRNKGRNKGQSCSPEISWGKRLASSLAVLCPPSSVSPPLFFFLFSTYLQ